MYEELENMHLHGDADENLERLLCRVVFPAEIPTEHNQDTSVDQSVRISEPVMRVSLEALD
jgi:hypothetical protein